MGRSDLAIRLGAELRGARRSAGLTQRQVAARSRISQPVISRLERGVASVDLAEVARVAAAVGHRISVRLFPEDGVRLRDSGQLGLAELIRAAAHPAWRIRLEVPVAASPDRRAADMVLDNSSEVVLIEIERRLHDLQAQLRAAQLKRVALAERIGRRVWLILAMPDTAAARHALAPHTGIIRAALPVTSRAAWAALRSGGELGGDAVLWVRRR
jgi:transcriptional regulator with XRE-family HTH domain